MKLGLRISKIVLLLVLASGIGGAHITDVKPENDDLLQVIRDISRRYNVHFTYDRDIVEDIEITEYRPDSYTNVDDALSNVLAGTQLKYVMLEMKYVIIYQDDAEGMRSLEQMIEVLENILKKNTEMRRVARLDLLESSTHLNRIHLEKHRMVINVTGVVTDQSGEPLIGVNVLVQGTGSGTATDFDGRFTLEDVNENATLIFSYIGYQTLEYPLRGRSNITITMAEDLQTLDEVVVVGYGVSKKSDLTGAVGSVRMDDALNSLPTVDFGQALYGKVPGVQVINNTGRPGESSTIQIRGINSVMAGATPLLVIDGVPLANFDLNTINSNDIETIDILKDASSTAIYGSRGANGVVLVTTKSGAAGKPKITFDYNHSIQNVIRFAEFMNAEEYASAAIDAAQNGWIESGGDPNAPNTIEARGDYLYTWPQSFENPGSLVNTNWQDLIYRAAPMHKFHLGISGGDQKSNYYVSAGYIDQKGIMKLSDYNKISLNLKANSEITDWLSIGAMTYTTLHFENLYPTDGSSFQNITQYPPIYPLYGENGYYGGPGTVPGYENYGQILYNITGHPFVKHHDEYKESRSDLLGNGFVELRLLPGLKFRSSINGALDRIERSVYVATDHNIGPSYIGSGNFTSSTIKRFNYSFENFLLYDFSENTNHKFNAIAGYEYNKRNYYFLSGNRINYDNDLLPFLSAGNTVAEATDDIYSSALVSALVRVNYNYQEKYLVTASFRRDGSSKFGPNSKWGNFPSVSAAWRVSEEKFFSNVNFIDNLKLRASLGYTGNVNFADYIWISQMTQGRIALGNNLTTSYYPSSIENPDLHWERTKQFNLGFDLGLLNNRIYLEADFYTSVSDGLLLDVPVPSTTGFSSIFRNIGELENRGVELSVISQNLVGQFSWETALTYSANRNKITKMGPDDAPRIYSTGHSMEGIDMVGHPMHQFYGYVFEGVFMTQAEVDAYQVEYPFAIHPGDARYADVNGDNVLNADDRAPIGNPQPDFNWSLGNSFSYKNFDLNFMWQGVVGSDLFNGNYRRSMIYHEGRNYLKRLNNRWRSESDPGDGTVPKISVILDGFEKTRSSFWITDGTYARLKNVTLGYTLPHALVQKINLSNARIYFNGFNLITITDAETEDPENFNVRGDFGSTDGRGVSHGVYPSAKIFTFGINVNF